MFTEQELREQELICRNDELQQEVDRLKAARAPGKDRATLMIRCKQLEVKNQKLERVVKLLRKKLGDR